MRICAHLIRGVEKKCSLGISPVNCSSCSMFQMKSRRSSQQPVIVSTNSHGSNGVAPETVGTVSYPVSAEQKILQSSAVKGGCGCRKG